MNAELRDTREKLLTAQSESRGMELALRNSKDLESEIISVRRERDELEKTLRELSKSPFFKDHDERVTNK